LAGDYYHFIGVTDIGTAVWQGTYGRFWSSTYSTDIYMHTGYFNSSSVYLQSSGNMRVNGHSIRCILESST
ncbi:hypothetical protein IJI18_01710, partial [Candidatus Saccharibacteria bacterium]|nr:hypothetical protein [Candidatus Saccharibacteria bacterium]